jgi:hypothetical protein
MSDSPRGPAVPGDRVLLCIDGAVTGELLDLTNHHPAPAPAPLIERRPGRYAGYFENAFGEQLVFVHDDGEADATLYLGDVDWEPRRVSDANGLPDVGDLILNGEERAFLGACWIATAWRREPRPRMALRSEGV